MTELIYKPCLFYRSCLLEIVDMQTNNILILANNNLTSKKKKQLGI